MAGPIIVGDLEFKSHCDEALSEIARRTKVALETCGLVAEGYAKRLCPVDTGRLRNSINHKQSGDTEYIGTNVEYAAYVEMGTYKTRAQPYLRPAVEDHKNEYKSLIDEIMKG